MQSKDRLKCGRDAHLQDMIIYLTAIGHALRHSNHRLSAPARLLAPCRLSAASGWPNSCALYFFTKTSSLSSCSLPPRLCPAHSKQTVSHHCTLSIRQHTSD